MEKIIKVGEYEFAAKSTAASLFSYKANFGRDGIRDFITLAKSIPSKPVSDSTSDQLDGLDFSNFDMDVFFRFLWVFAKAAKSDIPPMEQWLEGFETPPLDFAFAVLPQISDLLGSTMKSTVRPKN